MSHNKFILSPLSDILSDISSASYGAGSGIETFPLCDYVMQSVFLKLTGAQEQKMKCIFWEIASHDYEYRYRKLKQGIIGEFSSYKDKEGIYKDLASQLKKLRPSQPLSELIDYSETLKKTREAVDTAFEGTNLQIWSQKSYSEYKELVSAIKVCHFSDEMNLFVAKGNIKSENLLPFNKGLKEAYIDHLYAHRNRVAHNTLSFQQDLPTLSRLRSGEYIYENYFLHFFIIVLIDNIFIALFSRYLEVRETAFRS